MCQAPIAVDHACRKCRHNLILRDASLEIRPGLTSDVPAIEAVLRAAFPTDLESRLVGLLINRRQDAISLVAIMEGEIVGHVLFSAATIERDGQTITAG